MNCQPFIKFVKVFPFQTFALRYIAMCVGIQLYNSVFILQVDDVIVDSGPDLLTTCGNPANILSVNATYVVGVGGICSCYNNWTEYSLFASANLALIANNCSAAAIAPLPNVVTLVLLAAVSYFGKLF